MNTNNGFKILKKLNIIKSYLISEDVISNSIIEVIDELFKDESNNEIEQIRLELENGNKTKSLNILNNYKESISKILFQNPCSKKWYELIETDDYKIKYCTDCSKNVFLVVTSGNHSLKSYFACIPKRPRTHVPVLSSFQIPLSLISFSNSKY